MFSNNVLAEWERQNKVTVSSKSLQAPQLAKLLKMCGLGASKLSVKKRRILLLSCRRHNLPVDATLVAESLARDFNQPTNGSYGMFDII